MPASFEKTSAPLRGLAALKRFVRTHVHTPQRFSPCFDEHETRFRSAVCARRLDDGRSPVICTSMTDYSLLGAANYVGEQLKRHPALFLVWFTTSMRSAVRVNRIRTALAIYRRRFPEHRFVFLCNEEEERAAFAGAGMTAVLCNSNAFVDETVFQPIAGTERIYDAVYNGSMSPQKRRELARLVPHAAHIFRPVDNLSHAQSLALLGTMRQLMPTHDFLNKVDETGIEKLSRQEVNHVLARSCTGLCLSAREGAMFASVEYLLAGVPVVSTPALGGRHLFGSP